MEAIKKALGAAYQPIAFDDLREGDKVIAEEVGEYTEGVISSLEKGLYGGRYWETKEGDEVWEDADIYLVDRPKKELPKDRDTVLLRLKHKGEWYTGPYVKGSYCARDSTKDEWVITGHWVPEDEIEDFELGKVVPA